MSNNIKCVAIDDEPLALDVIAKFCKRIGDIDLSIYSNPALALEVVKREKPAIVFLDIEMDNISGLTIASKLPQETCFIFTTAYLDYAMDGFELDAVDYLHKPFSFNRFHTAFTRALRRIRGEESELKQSIIVKQEYNNVNIPLSEILYIEAMEGYVKIFRENDVCTVSRVILKNIGTQLPEPDFIRIHRSFIIHKSKVRSFNKREIELKNGKILPIGRQYTHSVTAILS